MLRLLLAVFTASLAASPLNAWTIKILTPANPYPDSDVLISTGSEYSTFRDYLTAKTGVTLSSGSLASHTIGSADAVIVDMVNLGGTYTAAERNVLATLRDSNVPILVIGEGEEWHPSNAQLATLIGATYNASTNGADTQAVNPAAWPILTQGVTSVRFASPGRFSAIGTGNIAITSDNAIVLAKNNKNFLVSLDSNWLQNGTSFIDSNTQFAQNVATFLSNPTTLPTIDSFTATGTPATPTAVIDADPKTGNGTLVTTVTWSTTDAATVEVSGLHLSSAAASGSEAVTLPAGLHTFRVTAHPGPVTLGWTTTNAGTLTLITPTGTEIDVTGQDSHTATAAGSWTLRATNANGTVTATATVTIPAAASMEVEVTVGSLPTIPPVIDDDTVVVFPDPEVPGGIVIGGEIVPPDPADPDQSQVFDIEQIILVTTTDLENGPWEPAARSTYTVDVTPEGQSFTVTVDPTADAARFWRVATTLQPVDASGAPQPGDTLHYSRVPFGQYKVTVPAGKKKLIAYQLDTTGTGSIALNQFVPTAPVNTNATRWTAGVQTTASYIRNGWSRAFDIALGEAVLVDNPTASPFTVTVTGTVPLSASTTLVNGTIIAVGSTLPIAGPLTGFSVTPVTNDNLTETTTGTLVTHSYIRSGWSGGVPTPGIGEGFLYDRRNVAAGWEQEITLTTDVPDLTIRK